MNELQMRSEHEKAVQHLKDEHAQRARLLLLQHKVNYMAGVAATQEAAQWLEKESQKISEDKHGSASCKWHMLTDQMEAKQSYGNYPDEVEYKNASLAESKELFRITTAKMLQRHLINHIKYDVCSDEQRDACKEAVGMLGFGISQNNGQDYFLVSLNKMWNPEKSVDYHKFYKSLTIKRLTNELHRVAKKLGHMSKSQAVSLYMRGKQGLKDQINHIIDKDPSWGRFD